MSQFICAVALFPKSERTRSQTTLTAFFTVFFSVFAILIDHSTAGESNATTAGKNILIVTGEDYPGHPWQETTPAIKRLLQNESQFSVKVLDRLSQLASADLSDFDAVILHFKNYDPKIPGRAGFDNLRRYVSSGGGLVLVHFACGAFQEFRNDFEEIAGRVWNPDLRGHDPFGTFRVEITDTDHPITAGMAAFETTDELYTCLDGQTPITTLATAVSKVDQRLYPIAFVLSHGDGRVFHCVLGHNVAAIENDGAATLLRRGTQWAAQSELD